MEPEQRIEINSSVLSEQSELLNTVFRMYIEDINPFIVRFEVSKGEFPIEVQNEIRAIYGHLVRAVMSDSPEQVLRNVEKMKSHSKRALLDCFKYTSIICSDNYDSFMSRYKNIDLTYLENGHFLTDIVKQCKKARQSLRDAKVAETSNISEEDLFNLYQDAYRQFENLNERLQQAEESASFLQHKASKKDLLSKISLWVGIGGFVVGIIGIIINFI